MASGATEAAVALIRLHRRLPPLRVPAPSPDRLRSSDEMTEAERQAEVMAGVIDAVLVGLDLTRAQFELGRQLLADALATAVDEQPSGGGW